MRQPRPQTLSCAARIINDDDREEFIASMVEADRLHTRATELRRHAWAIYHSRDDEARFA